MLLLGQIVGFFSVKFDLYASPCDFLRQNLICTQGVPCCFIIGQNLLHFGAKFDIVAF